MNETDVIGHLIQIESEAADMLLNAQAEADKRITEAKQKADNIYKEKYENLINELENTYNQQKKQIDEEIQRIVADCYKKALELLSQHKATLDAIASVLYEKENHLYPLDSFPAWRRQCMFPLFCHCKRLDRLYAAH